MIVHCYQIDPSLKLIRCEYEEAIHAVHNPEARVWIDVQETGNGQLEELLDNIGVKGSNPKTVPRGSWPRGVLSTECFYSHGNSGKG